MNALRLLAALAMWAASSVAAQQYPVKPVKIIVAFTAGGTTDVMARLVGQRFSERLKQPFVIENRPGAGGNLGTEIAVRSAPDGYTLLVNTVGPMAVNPSLYKNLAYNPITDLAPIALMTDVPNVLVVPHSLGITNLAGFVAYARAHPGELNYGSTGIGTSAHLSSVMFGARAGFTATHIPYKGAEALKDLLAGRIQFMFATIPSVIQHIRAGNLAAIAVSSVQRSRSMPQVPTVADSGFPGFEAGSWFGFFAPKGTPREVITTLNAAVNEIIAEKAVDSRLVDEGADPAAGTPERFGAFVARETEKWRAVVQQSGAKVD